MLARERIRQADEKWFHLTRARFVMEQDEVSRRSSKKIRGRRRIAARSLGLP
jgi:hypothetical protein